MIKGRKEQEQHHTGQVRELDAFNYFQKRKTVDFFHQLLIFSRLEPKRSKVFVIFKFSLKQVRCNRVDTYVGKSYVTVNFGTYSIH